jgi:hypothetical protein
MLIHIEVGLSREHDRHALFVPWIFLRGIYTIVSRDDDAPQAPQLVLLSKF